MTLRSAMPSRQRSHAVSRSDALRCGPDEHVALAEADVLDPDRRPVQPDGVAAHQPERHELVDRPVAIDDEVRADARQLAELAVGHVGSEGVERRAERRALGHVLDDHARAHEPVAVQAVVAAGVGGHLRAPACRVGDRRPGDRRAGGRGGRERPARALRARRASRMTVPAVPTAGAPVW